MMARARNVRQTRRNRRCRTDDQDNLGGDNGAQPKIVIVAKRRDQKPGYDEPGAGEACENRKDEFFRPRQSATQHDSEPDGAADIGGRQFDRQDDQPIGRNVQHAPNRPRQKFAEYVIM
jgi:hypothetical protein